MHKRNKIPRSGRKIRATLPIMILAATLIPASPASAKTSYAYAGGGSNYCEIDVNSPVYTYAGRDDRWFTISGKWWCAKKRTVHMTSFTWDGTIVRASRYITYKNVAKGSWSYRTNCDFVTRWATHEMIYLDQEAQIDQPAYIHADPGRTRGYCDHFGGS